MPDLSTSDRLDVVRAMLDDIWRNTPLKERIKPGWAIDTYRRIYEAGGGAEASGRGPLEAVLDALGRGKAIVPTSGGVLVELNAEAYTVRLSGTAVMVCDADDVAALHRLAECLKGMEAR